MPDCSEESPWSSRADELLESLDTDIHSGLSSDDAQERLKECGPNVLRTVRSRSVWQILIQQFKSLIIALLAAAAVLSFSFGEIVEGAAVAAVIAINALMGFITELRATRSMEALKELGSVRSRVIRDGRVIEIDADAVVPGDIVPLEAGDIVTSDIRLLEASRLQTNESALTGESMPVSKSIDPLEEGTELPEMTNMLFKGTSITRGSGRGLVVSTGMETEIGKVSDLVEKAEKERTPLEKRLDRLGHRLIWVTLLIALVTAASGILAGKDVLLMVKTSIALAVAAIPEGLPIVATMALARGMWRMARRNVLINRLSAVETLGATTVICTDKTGTLTENTMTVKAYFLPRGDGSQRTEAERSGSGSTVFRVEDTVIHLKEAPVLRRALRAGVLCNNVNPDDDSRMGDPMESALLRIGREAGMDIADLRSRLPRKQQEAFDTRSKMMATFHSTGEGDYLEAVKGAPEEVLKRCASIADGNGSKGMTDPIRGKWLEHNDNMAAKGLRVLALAERTVDNLGGEPYRDMTFLGLVGFMDPPRPEIEGAIETCQRAGIRVIMVTGDQPLTAGSIAREVGLAHPGEDSVIRGSQLQDPDSMTEEELDEMLRVQVFSRVSPEQKLNIIGAHQRAGDIVAMTGDGVNDAPALKKADIGISMGRRGTQVAHEASDMVLEDDLFTSIVAAVEQGRIIFSNIRKFVVYLLSCNVSEIMTVSLASLAGGPLPILPLQILFLNLVTDVFPALALGVGEGDPGAMQRPPRDPREPILTRSHWWRIGEYSALITAAVLGALAVSLLVLEMPTERAVTISFLTLAFSQLWHVFNMRAPDSGTLNNEITRNIYVWGALALCIAILLAAVYIEGISSILKLVDPGRSGWALVAAASLLPLAGGQLILHLRKRGE